MRDPSYDQTCSRIDDELRKTEHRWPPGAALLFIFAVCAVTWCLIGYACTRIG